MWLLLAAVLLFHSSRSENIGPAKQSYTYEAPLTLSGVVTFQDHFGPPNYGENPETDAHETAHVLNLSEPIYVIPDPTRDDDLSGDEFLGVRCIQLIGSSEIVRRIA